MLARIRKMHTSRVSGDLACRKPHGPRRLCTREMRSPTVIATWKQEDEVQWVVRSIDLVDFVAATITHAQQHAPTLRALIVVHSNFVERALLPVGAVRSCISSRGLTITTAQRSLSAKAMALPCHCAGFKVVHTHKPPSTHLVSDGERHFRHGLTGLGEDLASRYDVLHVWVARCQDGVQ